MQRPNKPREESVTPSAATISRRDFVKSTAVSAAAFPLVAFSQELRAAAEESGEVVKLRWLDGKPPAAFTGTTWGIPWPRGKYPSGTSFALQTASGRSAPVQTWTLAAWPDGSLKWTAHAVPADIDRSETLDLKPGQSPSAPEKPLSAVESADMIEIDNGLVHARIPKSGATVIESLSLAGNTRFRDARLICLLQDRAEPGSDGTLKQESYTGETSSATLEQAGPVRAVVKIEGKHKTTAGRAWLPFVLRLYFYAGSEAVRIMHTVIYDGDENHDFVRGLGLRFKAPISGLPHDRHIRFGGESAGLFAEAVRGLTGLRRDPGAAVTSAQLAGLATPPVESFPPTVSRRLHLIPAFGDWTLFQPNSDSFEIRKRTKEGYGWLTAGRGNRAGGLGYVGSPWGGVVFGMRNFWQSHPAQLDIRDAAGESAEVTMWLWAPDAPPMDMRFYHDGMGQDTYARQLEGLEITYEDYEPGFEKPYGVARTSELFIWATPATPTRERMVQLGDSLRAPAVITCSPDYLRSTGVFGGLFSLPDRSTPAKAMIEDQLDWQFAFYQKEVEQRRWFGYWNFGDVMHTYDPARHVWRYDVGGFAWDNSELSTDIWLWLYYLRTGRADVFRFAEAMTRHTGEVDVHHIGRFAPLGSRHNVVHWGCSAKQLRISTAQNRRYYYYLTGDERVGDLMREQVNADRALVTIVPVRKVSRDIPAQNPEAPLVGFGTDWGSLAAAWLTEWERGGDPIAQKKLLNSMRTIGAQPHGFFSSGGRMSLATGEFEIQPSDRASASHLSAVFGLVEVCAELVDLVDIPEFTAAWLQYCELFNATPEEQEKALGRPLGRLNLQQGHSRLTAFVAKKKGDRALAARAWREFRGGEGGVRVERRMQTQRVEGPAVLEPVEEAVRLSTNGAAQWGLAAIQCLALVGDQIPEK